LFHLFFDMAEVGNETNQSSINPDLKTQPKNNQAPIPDVDEAEEE
ncbi:unnamed protein product, partial [Didymodactylos carnosus]